MVVKDPSGGGFNSKLVRLKDFLHVGTGSTMLRFNSKLVRLKGVRIDWCGVGGKRFNSKLVRLKDFMKENFQCQ